MTNSLRVSSTLRLVSQTFRLVKKQQNRETSKIFLVDFYSRFNSKPETKYNTNICGAKRRRILSRL